MGVRGWEGGRAGGSGREGRRKWEEVGVRSGREGRRKWEEVGVRVGGNGRKWE